MPETDVPIITIKILASEPRDVRRDTLDGYEVGQRLGMTTRKLVYADLVTEDEVENLIATEFPGPEGGQGAFYFESRSGQDIVGHCYDRSNVLLTGSQKTPSTTPGL
jgi:hypothetical protein